MRTVIGYASVFGVVYPNGPAAVETVQPGAFAGETSAPAVVDRHDGPWVGTAAMQEDRHGLYVKLDFNERTPAGRCLLDGLLAGRIAGMSFATRPPEQHDYRNGVRVLTRARLDHVLFCSRGDNPATACLLLHRMMMTTRGFDAVAGPCRDNTLSLLRRAAELLTW